VSTCITLTGRREREPARWGWTVAAAALGLTAWSYWATGFSLRALLGSEGRALIVAYLAKLYPPDLSAPVLRETLRGAAETFAISFLGTLLAVAIALGLVFPASKTLMVSGLLFDLDRGPGARRWARRAAYLGAKAALNILRTVPHLVWALVLVFAVGIGPFPGTLALGIHTGGVLGRLFAEALEDVAPEPLEALQATGASRFQVLVYGIFPQVLPQFVAYTLYRWEVNIREATILGFVGAGGLGQRLHIAISLFLEQQLLTYILAIYLIVTAVDFLSAALRRRLL
jgi:phosphonate transport system permease protein